MMNTILVIGWLVFSYVLYFGIGMVLGGLKHGNLIRAIIITGLFVYNSVVNFGGFDNLIWAYENIAGFAVGQIISLITMNIAAYLGSRKPIIFGRRKWVI